jgi:hypothetical protein
MSVADAGTVAAKISATPRMISIHRLLLMRAS